ncbi:hypothetical protein Tco_0677024 [Tanacetum coccineum]
MDVKTSFLNGELDKEAPKQWHQKFDKVVLSSGYLLNQADKYVYNKLDESVSTPMDTSEKLMPNNGQAISQLEYSRVIGCLMYVMTFTSPDIAFALGKLSRSSIRTSSISFYLPRKKILFKERNNSLSELRFEVQELLKVINNTPMTNYEIKGVTTRGGKTMNHDVQTYITNVHAKEPLVVNHDKPVESNEVLDKDQPQTSNEPIIQPSNIIILDMLEDSRVPIILGRPFLATPQAMIDAFNKKIMLRVGNVEVIFDVDQSIKRPPAKDDECYGIDDLDDTINAEAQELLENDKSDSFLLKGLEKSINKSDLESCECFKSKADDDSDPRKPIRHIDYVNMLYSVSQKTERPDKVESEHL